uniref:Uncharacterized protein n=1 Tax=Rhizophora mucronata TaxID=61149 RepID=A0A2P2JF90_RHIMU
MLDKYQEADNKIIRKKLHAISRTNCYSTHKHADLKSCNALEELCVSSNQCCPGGIANVRATAGEKTITNQ